MRGAVRRGMDRLKEGSSMRIVLVVIAALLLAAPGSAWNEPDSFRGVPWGVSQADALALLQKAGEKVSCYLPSLCNTTQVMIGPVPTQIGYGFGKENKFEMAMLSFIPGHYENMKAIFVERYGAPSSTMQQPVKNRMGATFTNEIAIWAGERVVISLSRFGSKLDESRAVISLKSAVDSGAEEKKKAITKGKDDL
jgi:hypothetical protein